MKSDQTGKTPPHMWRSQFRPSSATRRRPRGSVTPAQLWTWIIALAVVLAVIIAIVWLVLPGNQGQTGNDSAGATSAMAASSETGPGTQTDSASTGTSN
jgi:hypothetical protein